jgi:peptide deformylase
MIRPVLKRGDPLLHEISREVCDIAEVDDVITDMWETLIAIRGLYDFSHGSGISAPQIGELWRISAVGHEGMDYTIINGRIVDHSDSVVPMREGCLSFFDFRGMPLRWQWVDVEGFDRNGEALKLHAEDGFSGLLQHELDHLDGRLYDSRLADGDNLFMYPDMPAIP